MYCVLHKQVLRHIAFTVFASFFFFCIVPSKLIHTGLPAHPIEIYKYWKNVYELSRVQIWITINSIFGEEFHWQHIDLNLSSSLTSSSRWLRALTASHSLLCRVILYYCFLHWHSLSDSPGHPMPKTITAPFPTHRTEWKKRRKPRFGFLPSIILLSSSSFFCFFSLSLSLSFIVDIAVTPLLLHTIFQFSFSFVAIESWNKNDTQLQRSILETSRSFPFFGCFGCSWRPNVKAS